MKRGTQISAVVLLLLAIYIMVTSIKKLGYKLNGLPGPGYAPFWIAVFLVIFALGILWEAKGLSGSSIFTPRALKMLAILTAAGVATIVLSLFLGLLTSLALIAGALIWLLGGSWKQAVITIIAVGICFNLLFQRLLMVTFPKGPLGF
ncbi:MAG TPA: tripartite tricarboxylate transporter TctB family protein [Thermosynergistes sp.]|nr:tripartite tricarboxylate transporter TctB family protein [Thermosynergistes sp.]